MKHFRLLVSLSMALVPCARILGADCPLPGDNSANGWVETGNCWLGTRRWQEAASAFRRALRIDPNLTAGAVGHAQALMASGEAVAASVELEGFVTEHPAAVPALDLYAEWLADRWKDNKEAARVLEQCTRLDPRNAEFRRRLADLHLKLGQPSEAMASYEDARRLSPQDPRPEVGLGRCLVLMARPAEAEQAFQRALILNRKLANPKAEVLFRHAEFLYGRNQFTESIEAYDGALAIDPSWSDAYMGRALAHAKRGEDKPARQDALAALKFGGERIDAHQLLLRLARAANASGDVRLHAEQINKLQAAEDERLRRDSRMRQLLREGKPLMAEARYPEAAARFEEILKLSPDNAEVYFALGVCYSQTGRDEDAIGLLRQYLSRRPSEADGYTVLGLLLLSRGRQVEARRELEHAVDLDPAQEEARRALAALPSP